jgi:hypothetical protein
MSLRGFLIDFELAVGFPFGWLVAVVAPPALAICALWWFG